MSTKTYQIKQKAWSLMPIYEIRDGSENLLYTVKMPGFSLWKKMDFRDVSGRKVFELQQKVWSFPPKFEIRENGTVVAEAHRRFAFFQHKVDLFIGVDTDIEITGNVFKREFEFQRNGQVVASVSKKRWSWRDSYGMNIETTEDQELLLASAIIIDLLLYNNNGGGAG